MRRTTTSHDLPGTDVADVASVERPSKTRRKAAMHELQDLGAALVALDPARVAEFDLPERLADAIAEARGTRSHEGRRRALQYVGRLMREIDAEPIRHALAQRARGQPTDAAEVAAAERWREALLGDDDALSRLVDTFPTADRRAFAQLVRDARVERTRGGPPHRYRELFRRLKALASARPAAAIPPEAS
ncbi:MAG: DUF615 domain-containing protein [Burkholderiales bacterium]|nr:DUF615 domain-containing protein [Burkholderiales bacterium]